MLSAHTTAMLLTLGVVAITVTLHYEGLNALNNALPRWRHVPARLRMLVLIALLLVLHLVEIGIFGLGIHMATHFPSLGGISGGHPALSLMDAVYLSATTYSTLGYGDLVPHGAIRILVGVESVVGLLMITWSASFTYLEMQRYWTPR
ncbi:Ion channel family protein [Oceanococcus atlanticus]|uniref:Ion channel family protein n=1 Tax=Oceanococcus atlanticus TaxID=1317117 RepID=A0A1Y1SDU4_9GAMM|nr:potassium channel family protein [Oceanococcus atlanticus]ORE87160.1 Ion channel family protein [Oceanococcus atlanticus]RZO86919.1 MAG: two pore domain potassium channel family protein [Oceanococcus sp.]